MVICIMKVELKLKVILSSFLALRASFVNLFMDDFQILARCLYNRANNEAGP